MENEPAVRLDQRLVQLGYAGSRERAKTLIKAGQVRINGQPCTKTATRCHPNTVIEVTAKDISWVSRAGLKLEKALEKWPVKVLDTICLDVGASTGGFTEVLLHRGALKVYALDVGHDQLALRLRSNPQVILMEGRNIRSATAEWFADRIDLITVDVSFISLKLLLPKIAELLKAEGEAVILIKPQFEVGKSRIKKGVAVDPALHQEVVNTIIDRAKKTGLAPVGVIESPITGVGGNKEFLLYLKKPLVPKAGNENRDLK